MYTVGLLYYFGFARTRLVRAAPEELAAREANQIDRTLGPKT
jgi:hypothetical protein